MPSAVELELEPPDDGPPLTSILPATVPPAKKRRPVRVLEGQLELFPRADTT